MDDYVVVRHPVVQKESHRGKRGGECHGAGYVERWQVVRVSDQVYVLESATSMGSGGVKVGLSNILARWCTAQVMA